MIPLSALTGANVVDRAADMPWYRGPTILEHLENVDITTDRNLFDARRLGLMKPSALFVNVTRGEIFDAEALMAAIKNGKLAGAGLDVAPQEPLPSDHPLWTTPNVIMTPHTAGASQFRISRNLDRFCRNIALYRDGKPLEGQINKSRGF